MKFPLATPLVLYLSLLLDELPLAQAIRFPVEGRIGGFSNQNAARNLGRLGRRASITGTPDLSNVGNVQYQTNITLNGQQFKVLVDTGSSDLSVTGTVQGAKDTGKTAEVTYAIGATSGPVKTATLDFEGYTVKDQAFIEQSVDSSHDEGGGIIGLGPGGASVVQSVYGQGQGDPVLDRIFRQNTSTPNFITILLGRAGDPTDTFVGDITVGEVVQPFGNITQQPKLPVTQMAHRSGQHWTALLDANGIIGPDGQKINTTKKSSGNRFNVMFDSGFTFPQVTKSVAAAIYGRVPGAKLTTVTGITGDMWTLPCSTELNVTFLFSGVQFPIHPLDTVTNAFYGPPDEHGNPTCIGAFQPTTDEQEGIDIILGMSFLRNAYIFINFGDFVDGALAKVGDPYVQLLPLTDPAEAHADFVQVRTNGVDHSSQLHLLPAVPDNSEDDDDDDDSSSSDSGIKKYLPYIIAGSVAGGLILIALVLYALFGGSRRKYRRLHDPAPAGLPATSLPNPYDNHPPPFAQYQPSRRY
ncbi:acid protease [Trametes coccinea BRFM310]|uniref:Acid protease n=1 Tax=Trametes coccinea (strain BRFM310) TaxID=1353009 RepID=A0A1Y2J1T0_TRAC3|nr:acid protease [Trametes coccinea BRFM310]